MHWSRMLWGRSRYVNYKKKRGGRGGEKKWVEESDVFQILFSDFRGYMRAKQQSCAFGKNKIISTTLQCVSRYLHMEAHNKNSIFCSKCAPCTSRCLNSTPVVWRHREEACLFRSFRGEKFMIGSGHWCLTEFNLRLKLLSHSVCADAKHIARPSL